MASSRIGIVGLLLSFLLVEVLALVFFARGFLLTRIHLKETQKYSSEHQRYKTPYKKLVWIIVDALRYDFVVEDGRYPCQSSQLNNNGSSSSDGACAYKHQMPFLSGFVVGQHAESSRVFRYIADAPTTTTQRLKAMTSGSLPIFFDVSNAFAAPSMDEDNLIDQFRAAGKKMVFMGDSTWTGLYPTQFDDPHPFPCYNIMDLHSVDDGIEELLPGVIQRGDWDVLVAHYLGVDHAGHAHGVDSEPMMKKLRQIDSSIRRTVESIKAQSHKGGLYEDTLVLVAGDHGQTLTGDHGGGSPEEVDSVLVAIDVNNLHTSRKSYYLECQKTCSCGQDRNQCVPDLMQIDLVPTLAAFMNTPIPFVNLGKVSKDLWSLIRHKPLVSPFLDILKANAEQVYQYLDRYQSQKSGGAGLPESTMATLRRAYKSLEENEDSYLDFLTSTEAFARSVWTQFHEGWMILGVAVMLSVVVFQLCLLYHFFVVAASDAKRDTSTNRIYFLRSVGVWLLNMVHPIGIFSFFFLLSEGAHVSMLVACMIVLTACLQNSKAALIRGSKHLIISVFCCYLISTLGLQSHSGFGFWQRLTVHDAEQTSHEGLGSTHTMNMLSQIIPFKIDPGSLSFAVHYFLPTLVLVMIVDQGVKTENHGGGWTCTATRISLTCGFISMATYHYISKHEELKDLALLNHVMPMIPDHMLPNALLQPALIVFPNICYGFVVIVLALALYQRIQRTVSLSSCFTRISAALALLLLLISPVATPLIGLGYFIQMKFSILHSRSMDRDWLSIVGCVSLMQSQAFYITGHLCEFSGLLYTAAFVGLADYHPIKSGLLLGTDTAGAMILSVILALGTLATGWEKTPKYDTGPSDPKAIKKKSNDNPQKRSSKASYLYIYTELPRVIVAENVAEEIPILGALVMFGLVRLLVCFCAMVSAGIQRRHLYAWALFAPKFIFEVYFLVISQLTLILMSLLL